MLKLDFIRFDGMKPPPHLELKSYNYCTQPQPTDDLDLYKVSSILGKYLKSLLQKQQKRFHIQS